ncbi:hypothetical protein OO7_05859 [Providencia sneebia DSM 19967]|uniref:Metal resistance protein n=2 Tax=Providencia sneebia TaxID=516075 RepID=K8WFW4_9GAMM|nr:hypothetical protein OO7_05859 [Providencia sneebia DSM 19967]
MNQRAVGKYLFAQNSSQELTNIHQLNEKKLTLQSGDFELNNSQVQLSSCELSAKSLFTVLPSIVEPMTFLLIAIAALSLFCTHLFSRQAHREKNTPRQMLGSICSFVISEIRAPLRSKSRCVLFWRNYAFFN